MREGTSWRAWPIAWHSLSLIVPALLVAACATECAAQDSWPHYIFPAPNAIPRGPGGYLSWVKLLLLWGLFLAWLTTVDWISRDTQKSGMPYAMWNPIVFFPFFLSLFLFGMTLPLFAAGYALCVLAYLGPTLTYVFLRNQRMELHERVLTPSHLRHLAVELLARGGIKIAGQGKAAHEKGAPVTMIATGAADKLKDQANEISARQAKGFLPAKALMAAAIDHRAEKLMLDYSPQDVTTRYLIDGVWHDAEAHDREEGDGILFVLKTLSDLKPQDRRSRQSGKFKLEYQKRKMNCSIVTQGTQTGERVICGLAEQKIPFKTLEELGMRPKMIERLKELMLSQRGFMLFSSLPSGGLSTTLSIALRSTDRIMRDFIVLEDIADTLEDIENVDPITYNGAKGETPDAVLDTVLRKQPDVLILPNLVNAATVQRLCDAATEEQLVIGCVRAKEAVESLLRILLLKVPAKEFAPVVTAVVCQRLVRKLCETCKEEYAPPAQLLAKLGIPAGRVDKLYRHPENPEKECPACHGLGYIGRTGIFELLMVDDTLRDALVSQPKLEILRGIARKAGHTTLQEEGLAKVIQGITSLPELMRVMKQ